MRVAGSWSWAMRIRRLSTSSRRLTWPTVADFAAFLALEKESLKEAQSYLTTAAQRRNRLGRYFDRRVVYMVDRLSR